MATAVKCLASVMWKSKMRRPGEVVLDMDDGEATRLAGLKAVEIQNPKKAQASTDAAK